MLLLVMRHGTAEDASPSGRDADRPLSAEGRARVLDVSRALASQLTGHTSPLPTLVASPLLRARQTAELVRSVLPGTREIRLAPELEPDEEPALLLVGQLALAGENAMLVGHQPHVERLVRRLTLPGELVALARGFSTAMVIGLEPGEVRAASGQGLALPRPGGWRLRIALDPRTLG